MRLQTAILFPLALCPGAASLPNRAEINKNFGNIPLYFEENRGRFITRGPGYSASITNQGAEISFGAGHKSARITMCVAGARRAAQPEAVAPLAAFSNYYVGNDPAHWTTGVQHYEKVRVPGIRPGIDLVYHGDQKRLEYDFEVSPGADARGLRLQLSGAESLSIDSAGDLVIRTAAGDVTQHKPVAWQMNGAIRQPVDAAYSQLRGNEVAIRIGAYNPKLALTIDPVLSYSTYLGGSQYDVAASVAVDAFGYTYIAGFTYSSDFPATSGRNQGGADIFVTKLNPSGTAIVYSTYIGGANNDQANAIALDPFGNAYITGVTSSPNFPVVGFANSTGSGGSDVIFCKLGSTGALIYSRRFGGSGNDEGNAIAVDTSGNAYIAGSTGSSDFPTTAGSFQQTLPQVGFATGFVGKFFSNGAVAYLTYLGGTFSDAASAIAVDASRNAYVTGNAYSPDFPVTAGAFQTASRGFPNAFVSKLNSDGTALVYSTFLGGQGQNSGQGIAVDPSGNAYVAGTTASQDFPVTAGAFSTRNGANYFRDAFVTKINPSGSVLIYSTYLGGSSDNSASGIAVDAAGSAFVTGTTVSYDFPTTPGALSNQLESGAFGNESGFLTQVNPAGAALTYSTYLTYLGTPINSPQPTRIAMDNAGGVYLVGSTYGNSLQTTPGVFQPSSHNKDASLFSGFAAKIDMSSPVSCNVVLSNNSISIPGRGATGTVAFTLAQGCQWQITSNTWITITSPTSGFGSGSVAFTAQVNDDLVDARTGTIRVNGGVLTPGTNIYTLNQAPGSCADPAFSTSSQLTFDAAGGVTNVGIVLPSFCSWNIVNPQPWITVSSGMVRNGNGTFSLFVPRNSFVQRQGTVTVAGRPLSIVQPGGTCTATLASNSASFATAGGAGAVAFTLNNNACAWTAYSSAAWIQLNAASFTGQGGGVVPFTVAFNPSVSPRSGQITIGDQIYQVAQTGGVANNGSAFTQTQILSYGQLSQLSEIALDAMGNLYVIEHGRSRVILVDPLGALTPFAGGGAASPGDGGAPTAALLSSPAGIAIVGANIYFADFSQNRVRRVSGNVISTVAGTGTQGYNGDGRAATGLMLNSPAGVAADASGVLYVSEQGNNRIRKIAPDGTMTTFAGNGTAGFSGDSGPATSATLRSPGTISVDGAGTVYFVDAGNGRIRKIAPGGMIATVAGNGNQSVSADGTPAATASLYYPHALSVDPSGIIYFAENEKIRRIGPDGLLQTISGPNFYPSLGGLFADGLGNVYETESNGGFINKFVPTPIFCSFAVTPPATQISGGGSLTLTVTTTPGCTWSAASSTPWITYTGTANGASTFTLASNTTQAPRTGTIAIAGQNITLTQNAPISSPTVFVTALYQDLLNRAPDPGGLAFYLAGLNSGSLTRSQAASQFFTSPEFSNAGLYVIKLYFAVLKRNPDFPGWKFWFDSLNSGQPPTTVLNGFLNSQEFLQIYGNVTNADFVTLAYQNVLGHQPDAGGYAYWLGLLNSGRVTRAYVFDQFVRSPEYDSTVRARAYANLLYMGFLRRAVDPGGVAYWTNVLSNPAALSDAIRGFIESPEYAGRF